MNYSRHRIAAKKKLAEKNSVLNKMEGKDRANAEQMVIDQAIKESDEKEESKKVSNKKNKKKNRK